MGVCLQPVKSFNVPHKLAKKIAKTGSKMTVQEQSRTFLAVGMKIKILESKIDYFKVYNTFSLMFRVFEEHTANVFTAIS